MELLERKWTLMPQLRTRYHKIMRNYESILRVFFDKKKTHSSFSSFLHFCFFILHSFLFLSTFLHKYLCSFISFLRKKKNSLTHSLTHSLTLLFLCLGFYFEIFKYIYFQVYLKFSTNVICFCMNWLLNLFFFSLLVTE